VNSERNEARDDRVERPEGQLLIAPERTTTSDWRIDAPDRPRATSA
jgi:hypothetical protein